MWIALIAIVVVLVGLSTTKFEVRHEIEINASAEKVWQTVIDFKNYHHWNTQLSYLGGEVKHNGKLYLRLAV